LKECVENLRDSIETVAFTVSLHVLAVNKSDSRYHGRHFWARLQECEKRLLASSCLSVRLCVCMEHLGSHWKDFHEIWYEYFSKNLSRKIKFN